MTSDGADEKIKHEGMEQAEEVEYYQDKDAQIN